MQNEGIFAGNIGLPFAIESAPMACRMLLGKRNLANMGFFAQPLEKVE